MLGYIKLLFYILSLQSRRPALGTNYHWLERWRLADGEGFHFLPPPPPAERSFDPEAGLCCWRAVVEMGGGRVPSVWAAAVRAPEVGPLAVGALQVLSCMHSEQLCVRASYSSLRATSFITCSPSSCGVSASGSSLIARGLSASRPQSRLVYSSHLTYVITIFKPIEPRTRSYQP